MSAKLSPDTTHRKCSKCRVVLPLEAFSIARSKPLGRAYECRPCQRAYNHAYHENTKGRSRPTKRDMEQGPWPVPAHGLTEQLDCVRLRKWAKGLANTESRLVPALGMPVMGMREVA